MKKTTLTKIAGMLTMLAMLVTLIAAFAVGVSAEGTAQAQWGTDAENLTNEGTLQAALDAAAGDASITYIKVANNVDLGDSSIRANGGNFTFDLNGKTITSNTYLFYVGSSGNVTITDTGEGGKLYSTGSGIISPRDISNIRITIAGGTIECVKSSPVNLDYSGMETSAELIVTGGTLVTQDKTSALISASGESVKLTGGTFEGGKAVISWGKGTVDLSDHPAPAGITVYHRFGSDVTLNGENIILPEGCYISDTVGGEAVATMTDYDIYYVAGEPTASTPEPDPTPDPEPIIEAQWGDDAENLTSSGTLIEAFDAAAAENSTVAYIKMISDVTLEVVPNTTGGTFTFDLNGKKLSTGGLFTIYNANITVTDTAGNGVIDAAGGEQAAALVGGKLTLLGGEIHGDWDLYWEGGELDLQSYPMLTGFVLYYAGEALDLSDASCLLPDGYSLYYGNDSSLEKVDSLENSCSYFIDETKYKVTVNETANGVVIADQTGYLTPSTEVTLTVTPDEGYKVDVTVTGATFDPETNSFIVGNSDVTVEVTFRLYQAEWGTDKDTLTAWGTLEEALDAAASDANVEYIKVINNVDLGDAYMKATGGTFTLDLNGRTVTSTDYTLCLYNSVNITITDSGGGGKIETTNPNASAIFVHDTSAINLTIEGGTFSSAGHVIVAQSAFGKVLTVNLTIKGGTLQAAINEHIWWGSTGVLDLSGYANPTGITVNNFSGADPNITLPAGYSFYDKNGNRVDGAFENVLYIIDKAQYQLYWDIGNGINGENSSFSHGNEMLVWGTPVSFTLVLLDHYELVSVALNGKALEPDAETGVYSFVMPKDDVTVTVKAKYAPFVWGNTSDAMTNTGDFFDLVAAINAGETLYAKLLADYEVELLEGNVTVSGKSRIDLGEYYLNVYNGAVILGDGADVTFFGDQKVDDINADCNAVGSFELQAGSKLTVSGVAFWGEILYNGGMLDISGAHLYTSLRFYNLTNAEVTISDVITLGTRFRAFDTSYYESVYEGYTIPTVTTLAGRVENIASAYVEAVFNVTFDFGEGSGTMPTIEVSGGQTGRDIPTPEGVSHPEGLSLIGWTYEGKNYDYLLADLIYALEPADVTLTAKWGAPIYVGGVGMNDGDYLASGATKTTKSRPAAGGYAYYKNGVLTLNNYQFSGEGFIHEYDGFYGDKYYSLIYSTVDLVIELVGGSNLVGTAIFYEGEIDYYYKADTDGIRIRGDLTVCGSGSLRIEVEDDGLYINDLTFEGGTVTVVTDDEAIESDSITVIDGVLITLSEDGIDSDIVTVKGGEFYVLPENESEDDLEFATDVLTVEGGLLVVKGGAIESDCITISGGTVEVNREIYGEAIKNTDEYTAGTLGDDAPTPFLNITGGKVTLISYGIGIDFCGDITVSGGKLTVDTYSGPAIVLQDASLTLSGGEVALFSVEGECIAVIDGNITVSDGELSMSTEFYGIYAGADCTVTVTGGKLNVSDALIAISAADENATLSLNISGGEVCLNVEGAAFQGTDLTISGGNVIMNGHIGVFANNMTVSGGRILISADESSEFDIPFVAIILEQALTVSGTKTALMIQGAIEVKGETSVNTEEVLARTPTLPESEGVFYEGVEITHNWSETYSFNESKHWHVCTDKDCTVMHFAKVFSQAMGVPDGYAESIALELCGMFLATEMGLGEHTVPDGETVCSVCGYGAEEPGEEIPEDAVLVVGDHYLKSGEYLTLNGDIVTEKPESGYLYVEIDGEDGTIILNNFTIEHTGQALLVPNPTYNELAIRWKMHLEGDNVLTVHPAAQGQFLGEIELNGVGIVSNAYLLVVGNGKLIVNAEIGVFTTSEAFGIGEGATVILNAEIGVATLGGFLGVGKGATVTVNANTYGILAPQSLLVEDATLNVYVTAGTGIYRAGVVNFSENSSVTITAGEDGIVMMGGGISIGNNNQQLTITAQGNGIVLEGTKVYSDNATVNLTAKEAGLLLQNTEFRFDGGIFNLQAKYNGIYEGSDLIFDFTTLNIFATDTAIVLDDSILYICDGTEVSIVSRDMGVYSYMGSDFVVQDAKLTIDAARYGIYGNISFTINGTVPDVSVRAMDAIRCFEINLDSDVTYLMNAYMDVDYENGGATFYNDADNIASYVTIRSTDLVMQEMTEATEKLEQLLSEGGEFDAIAGAISDVNGLLDTLTNADGEGRLDLIEKGNEAINAAIKTLDENLKNAQTNLQNAIDTKADSATVAQNIADLTDALTAAEAAYAAADAEIEDKLTDAQTTLNNAIEAVDARVDEAKAALEAAIAQGDATLTTEIETLSDALTAAEAAYAAADEEIEDKLSDAQTTLNSAIEAVDARVDEAKAALEAAIAQGNATLTTEIETLSDALTAAEAAYAAADAEIEDKLTDAQTTLNNAIGAVDKKLDDAKAALDKAIVDGDTELLQKVEDLNQALAEAKAANKTADGEMKTELTAKMEEAQSSLSAAIVALQSELNSAKVELRQQNQHADATLRTELDAMKAELVEADKKSASRQTVTTVIAIVTLVCNVGLIGAMIIIESKKKILVPAFKSGFGKMASKFKKPTAKAESSNSDDSGSEE